MAATTARDSPSSPISVKVSKEASDSNLPVAPSTADAWSVDPANPWRWSSRRKTYQVFGAALATTWSNFASVIYLAAHQDVAGKYHISTELAILPMSTMTLGFAIGNTTGAPVSEAIGRRPTYWVWLPISALFILGAGFCNNIYSLAICRFFAGLFGGTVASVGSGGTVPDLYSPRERTTALDIMVGMTFQGPAVAMLVGSYAVQYGSGWPWSSWVASMFAAVTLLCMVPMQETNHAIIKQRLGETQGGILTEQRAAWQRIKGVPFGKVLQRPLRMLVTHPVVTAVGAYTAFVFGIVYGMAAASSYIFAAVYGFDVGSSGLIWIAWALGFACGSVANSLAQKRLLRSLRDTELRKRYRPEWVLFPAMAAGPFVPAALFWAAWSARPSIHYMVPTVALGLYAMSMYLVYISGLTYLIQFYGPEFGASAAAGARLLSFVLGIASPLFSLPLFTGLGINWGISLLAFIAVVLTPIPYLLYLFGPKLRASSHDG